MTTRSFDTQERAEFRQLAPALRQFRQAYAARVRKQGRLFLSALGEYRDLWNKDLHEAGGDVLPHIGTVWARVDAGTAQTGVSQFLSALDASVVLGNRQMIIDLAAQRGISVRQTRLMRQFLRDIFANDPFVQFALAQPESRDDPIKAAMDTFDPDAPSAGLISAASPFTVRNRRAEMWIRNHGAELVARIDEATRSQIRTVLNRGMRDGVAYSKVARELKARFEVLSTPSPLRHIRTRAELIAVTEARFAQTYGKQAMAAEIEQRGVRMQKRWRTIGDERVSDGCNELGDLGWIPASEEWPGGISGPPLHPGCRCIMSHRVAR